MKNRTIFITDAAWFESGAFRNPIATLDQELKTYDEHFHCLFYDTRILATTPPTKHEKESSFYNDYRDRYGTKDLQAIKRAVEKGGGKTVFLNGVDQEVFDYIAPLIKTSVEVLYLFKCSKIVDLGALSTFKNLQCVHIFHNPSLTKLWEMKNTLNLKILSLQWVPNIKNAESLADSFVEYLHWDSMGNSGNKTSALFDTALLENLPTGKYISISFANCTIKKCN